MLALAVLLLLPRLAKTAELYNPLDPTGSGDVTINTVFGRLIQAMLGVTGSIALLMFVYGGFLWLISAGVEDRVKKGKEVIKWSVFGLVIIVGAYTIVRAVVSALESGTI
jgi:type IV secretory pathway VirB2 component (pilin)